MLHSPLYAACSLSTCCRALQPCLHVNILNHTSAQDTSELKAKKKKHKLFSMGVLGWVHASSETRRKKAERGRRKEQRTLEFILTGAEVAVRELVKRGPVVVDVPAGKIEARWSSDTASPTAGPHSLTGQIKSSKLTRSRGRCRPAWRRPAW
jgi:hypothetical protein